MPRTPMNDRRESRTVRITHVWAPGSMQEQHEDFPITFSCMPNGENIGEVFYDHDATGIQSNERIAQFRREACVLISLALQWGVPLETLRDAMGHARHNFLGNDRIIPHTIFGAILDALAREQGLPEPVLPIDPIDTES